MEADRFKRVEVTSKQALWDWLSANHDREDGIWLVTWKATHRDKYLSRDAVFDALLAHGWIDGRRMAVDDDRTSQFVSPRRQQGWTESYRIRAERLIAEGRMHPAGQRSIDAAQASGRWVDLPEVDALTIPDDLRDALSAAGGAAWFDASAPSYRRNVLRWIAKAKRPATRADRVNKVANAAASGSKVPQM